MTENEKRLRRELECMKAAYPVRAVKALEMYDALLAEHRAEVERLTVQLNKAAVALTMVETERVSARDAALEEAARTIDTGWQARGRAFAEEIRALKSRPAEVVPVSELRKHLLQLREGARNGKAFGLTDVRASGRLDVINHLEIVLGIDLDAECDCGHVSIGTNSLCARIITTPGGAVAACGCSHHSHAMPVPRELATEENGLLPKRRKTEDARQTCTCTGACKGAAGLGAGWRCALEKAP